MFCIRCIEYSKTSVTIKMAKTERHTLITDSSKDLPNHRTQVNPMRYRNTRCTRPSDFFYQRRAYENATYEPT